MGERLTVELPDDLARRARALAAASHRRLEDVVVDWIGRAVAEPPVESLDDGSLLSLCDATLDASAQGRLTDLLARAREGGLATGEREELDAIMDAYRRGLVTKARAWREAVSRGLRSAPVDDDAA